MCEGLSVHVLRLVFQSLCVKGSQSLQTKSQTVEEAANELINMLCESEPEGEARDEESDLEDEVEGMSRRTETSYRDNIL